MGSPAGCFGSPLGGGVGDFVSSGIATEGTNLRRRGSLEERYLLTACKVSVNRGAEAAVALCGCEFETSRAASVLSPFRRRLVAFDQFTNSQRVGLAMAVAGDRGGAARGIDANVG